MKKNIPLLVLWFVATALALGRTNPARAADGPSVATAAVESSGGVVARPETVTYLRDVLPIFMGKCARCHGDQNSVLPDWMDYRTAYSDRLEIKRRVWHSWKGAYYKQTMPAGNGQEAQTMTEDERLIVKRWVEEGAPQGVPPADSGVHTKAEKIVLGKQLFNTLCAACHQTGGQGIPTRFPPLAGSDFLNTDKHRAIKALVNGLQGELVVNGRTFDGTMPKFTLSDQDIANALTYVYNSFGNSAKEVFPEEVRAARAEKITPLVSTTVPGVAATKKTNPFE